MTCPRLLLRVLLVAAALVTIAPRASQAQIINTLEYLLTDDETLELHTGNTGNTISQATVGNALLRVKWRQPQLHEYYTWDGSYVYLRYDNTWGDHDGATSYEFREFPGKGGRWMKRQMAVGESIVVFDPDGQWWYRPDCTLHSVHPLAYTNTLQAYYPNYNLGGDLGTDAVIVLKYDWDSSPADNYERFFFSKKWGWVRWEHWANGSVQNSVNWNRKSSRQAVPPQPKCVLFPPACSPPNLSCSGSWQCTGRQCFVQPPAPGECQAGYPWCYAGCCCRCV